MTVVLQTVNDRWQFSASSAVSELSLGERFAGVADDFQMPVLHLLEHTAHRKLVRIAKVLGRPQALPGLMR